MQFSLVAGWMARTMDGWMMDEWHDGWMVVWRDG